MKRTSVPRTDIDPKILELVKKDYGETLELVNRTEWHYTFNGFEGGPKSYINISRFKAEKGFEVSAAEMREQWPQWNQCQRIDFAFNWHTKDTWTDNDTEILEIIMADGDDGVWQRCTQAFLKHPDRNRAVSFLVDRVLHHLGVQEDVFCGPIPYFPYFVTAGALFKITGSPEYEQSIRKFFDHEDEGVRFLAELALEIEGPTTEFFNAGRRKPLTLESKVKSFTYQRTVMTTWFGTILFKIDFLAKILTYQRGVTASWFGVILAKIGQHKKKSRTTHSVLNKIICACQPSSLPRTAHSINHHLARSRHCKIGRVSSLGTLC
jgi:hypothetical protein